MFKKTIAGLAAAAALMVTAAQACPNFNLRPHFGSIQLEAGFLPDPQTRNVTAGGTINLNRCNLGNNVFIWGEEVNGFVTSRPDFSLNWYGVSNQLTIAIESNADAILLVNAPDGRTWYYDDDYRGLDPAITLQNPQQGRYDIWIGSYDGTRRNPARLVFTEYNY